MGSCHHNGFCRVHGTPAAQSKHRVDTFLFGKFCAFLNIVQDRVRNHLVKEGGAVRLPPIPISLSYRPGRLFLGRSEPVGRRIDQRSIGWQGAHDDEDTFLGTDILPAVWYSARMADRVPSVQDEFTIVHPIPKLSLHHIP